MFFLYTHCLIAFFPKFSQVDVDEAPEIVEKYDANELPITLVFKDGIVVERKVGGSIDLNGLIARYL